MERLTECNPVTADEGARRVASQRAFEGRTVAEIIADPATPKHIRSLMQDVVASWVRIDAEAEKLKAWALEGRDNG